MSILETSTSKRRARTRLTDVRVHHDDDGDNGSVTVGDDHKFRKTVKRKEEKGKYNLSSSQRWVTIQEMTVSILI